MSDFLQSELLKRASGLTSNGLNLLQSIGNPLGFVTDKVLGAYGSSQLKNQDLTQKSNDYFETRTNALDPTAILETVTGQTRDKKLEALSKQYDKKYKDTEGAFLTPDVRNDKGGVILPAEVRRREAALRRASEAAKSDGVSAAQLFGGDKTKLYTADPSAVASEVTRLADDKAQKKAVQGINNKVLETELLDDAEYGDGASRVTDDGAHVLGSNKSRYQRREKQRLDIQKKELEQKAQIEGEALYGDRYGKGIGTKQLDLDIAGEAKYGDLYGTAGTAQLDNQLALGLYKDKLGADFNSQGARYNRYRDQEADRRGDYRFDVKRADSIAAQRAEIDLAKLKMQHEVDIIDRQHDMDMEVFQQQQIGNLLGGLFSLGSLL